MNDERRVPITLRMPRALLDRLKEAADARSHSMNAEIVQRLDTSFPVSLNKADMEKFKHDLKPQDLFEENLMVAWRCLDEPNKEAVLQIVKIMAEYDYGMSRKDGIK
ncbi:Arc family DNA-binding protein [Acetobacter senegalensis]|uniref:Arc family DNA-binding protein n=1 Tax=Acetobacter senegalensis TaxID=446692 RepID=UPI001EDBC1F3|nr:Arc family DNA-binding protein [Acetobacter senegalensis]MCG4261385.1 Arc family DNA-binding protein [Acetobacter senegalensis]